MKGHKGRSSRRGLCSHAFVPPVQALSVGGPLTSGGGYSGCRCSAPASAPGAPSPSWRGLFGSEPSGACWPVVSSGSLLRSRLLLLLSRSLSLSRRSRSSRSRLLSRRSLLSRSLSLSLSRSRRSRSSSLSRLLSRLLRSLSLERERDLRLLSRLPSSSSSRRLRSLRPRLLRPKSLRSRSGSRGFTCMKLQVPPRSQALTSC